MGLELNEYGMQQQRIAYMRFLGELYNYELVDSSLIFDTLYLILNFGHGTTEVWSCYHESTFFRRTILNALFYIYFLRVAR